jgi:hypothetical protein
MKFFNNSQLVGESVQDDQERLCAMLAWYATRAQGLMIEE